MKGKNFSCNNATGERHKSDLYETPHSITARLLDVEDFSDGVVLEPAAGKGAIVQVLEKRGYEVVAYDKETDFLQEKNLYDYVVTNPPYSSAMAFILKAKEVAIKKFCFLLPLAYLHGKKRFDAIYSDKVYPLKRVCVFTRYPMLGEKLREDGKYNTGMMVYAWFVWCRAYKGEATITWLDNNEDILRKASNAQGKIQAGTLFQVR